VKVRANPKYRQLKEILREEINKRKLRPGDRIPSEERIAEKYGVSLGTVRQAMAELANEGLIYKEQGRGTFVAEKKRGKTFTIGLLLTDIGNPFFSQIARSIQEKAHLLGYSMIYYNTNDQLSREAESIDMLIKRRVDGVILVPVLKDGEEKLMQKLRGNDISFVYLDRYLNEPASDYIIVDNFCGVRQSMEYLISLGHKRIGCISAQPYTWVLEQRVKAYKKIVRENNLAMEDSLVQISDLPDDKGGYDAANKLFSMKNRPTAIFATNDIIAIGAYKAAKDKGIRIPQDLSLVGFDDIEVSSHLEVPLTTVSQPINKMGEMAVKILAEKGKKENPEKVQKIVLEPKLVIRESCTGKYKVRGQGERIKISQEGGEKQVGY